MPITPLPSTKENTVWEARIVKRQKDAKQEIPIEEPQIIKNERLSENRITVAQRLYKPDVLIEITEQALRKAQLMIGVLVDLWVRLFGHKSKP